MDTLQSPIHPCYGSVWTRYRQHKRSNICITILNIIIFGVYTRVLEAKCIQIRDVSFDTTDGGGREWEVLSFFLPNTIVQQIIENKLNCLFG